MLHAMRMNYRPSRSFVCCLVPLLVVGGAGAVLWHRASALHLAIRANLTFLEALKFKDTLDTNPPTPEQIAKVRNEAIALKEKLVAEFPALKVVPRPVPDEANGYLLLHKLSGGGDPALGRLPVSAESV